MKTTNYIKAVYVLALLGASMMIHAQEENTNYLNREMTLEREYDPSVQDANKVNTLPEVKEPEVKKIPIDYAGLTFPTFPEKEITVLPSGKIMTDMDYNKRRGYLNFGVGTLPNLRGDVGYHILSSDRDQLNLFFSHRSMNSQVRHLQSDEKVKAKINDNLGGINYRHLFNKLDFKIGAKYGYSAFNYYECYEFPLYDAMLPREELPAVVDRDTKQVGQTIQVYTGFASRDNTPFGYLFDLSYTNFSYKYGISPIADGPTEHTVDLDFDLNAGLNGNQTIGVGGNIQYFNYSLPDPVQIPGGVDYWYNCNFNNFAAVSLSPYYKVEGGNWNLHLGANVMFFTGDDKKMMASPNILADVKVANKTVLYAAAKGELRSNSLYQLSQLNRYANPTNRVTPSRNWLDTKVGVKSGVIPGFWFDIFGGYKVTSSDFFYLPYRTYLANDFSNIIGYMNDIDTKLLFVGADLKYSYQKFLDIRLKGVYNHWKANLGDDWIGGESNAEITPLGRPKLEITAGVTLRPIENLSLELDYYLGTDRYADLFGAEEIKLDNINDLNVTGSYEINKTFSVYARLNNLLFQKYDYYYGHPVPNFSATFGVNINF